MASKGTSLLLADVADEESTSEYVAVEPCSICLTDYAEGDVLCWSQNSRCKHCFHKECAIEWLLKHEECPLCRHNYLSLDGDDELSGEGAGLPSAAREGDTPSEAQPILRGMNLLFLLSRLQLLSDERPNTTIRLEDVELTNGRRGTLEFRRSTAATAIDVGGQGFIMSLRDIEDVDEEAPSRRNGVQVNTTR